MYAALMGQRVKLVFIWYPGAPYSIFTYTKLLTLIVVTKKALGVMSSKTESDIDILIISIIKENIDC